uniref:Transcription factor JunB n=1 Tax=Sander lucioperca TaxID=283035 RepID=A0A8C9ZFT5_SANLU
MSTKMEQPFYHDDSFLSAYGHSDAAMHDYKLLKQNMNLNLTEPYRSLKSQLRAEIEPYQGAGGGHPHPHHHHHHHQDVQGSLKLASPELERLIIQNSNGVITTPTPGQYFYNRGITDEQEGFAEGFVKALDELHKMNQMAPPNVSIGAGGVTCSAAAAASSHQQQPQHQQKEPQIVPDLLSSDGSPPMSPIDLETQERIKAERKRLRNRLAATKCRRRKLERIARDNAGLSSTASVLRDQVAQLKQKVLTHVSSGCQLMLTSKLEAF